MEEHGGNIYGKDIKIDFSVNVNPFGMPKAVKEAAIRGVEESFRYPDIEERRLRKAIADDICVPEERIVIGNGAAELIYGAAEAFRPGKALVCSPSFGEYEKALLACRSRICYFTAEKEAGWQVSGKLTEQVKREKNLEMVFLCTPNNPTGRLIPAEILAELAGICHEKKIILAVDECFLDLTEEGEAVSCLSLQEKCPELIVLRAFTKLYAMPGLRLGYMAAGSKEAAAKIESILPPWNVSWPAQMAGCAALREKEFARKTRKYLLNERKWLARKLEELGFYVWPSDTTFLLFRGPKDLQERCLAEGIYIRDAASFRGIDAGTWRIGVRLHEENLILLNLLEKIIKEERKTDGWQK